MELGLRGRTAVISGGSKGIGKGIARALAAEGVRVVLLARDRENLDKAADEIRREFGVEALAVQTDITNAESVRDAATQVRARCGAVNIVINNAGAAIQRKDPAITWDDSEWLSEIQVKSVGALRIIREFLPLIARDGSGRIINVTGASGVMTWLPALTYGLNNAGISHVTGYLAADLAAEGITVNAVVPGLVGTEWRHGWADAAAKQVNKTRAEWLKEFCLSKGIVCGRWAEVEEIGDTVAFLASDRARYINGAKIAVDGGLTVNAR